MVKSIARFRTMLLGLSGAVALSCVAARGPAKQDLDIPAADGEVLRATYYSASKPGPGVVLLHMCNSDRTAWSSLGPKLAERGIHALALDYRGFGESGGELGEDAQQRQAIRTEKWPGDVDAALAALLEQPGVDRQRLGAAGGSCGVNQAIQLARRHSDVKTLVLLAGTTTREGEAFLSDNGRLPLYASASLDDGNAVDELRWLLGFSSHPENHFAEYDHGGHGTEMFAVHADLEPSIVDWFEQYLVAGVPAPPEDGAPTMGGPSTKLAGQVREPGGVEALRQRFEARGDSSVLPPESVVNRIGYELLQQGEAARAIEVLRLNVDAHPQSANTYDSLADAYLANGQRELATEYAEKTLQALESDPNIDEELARLLRQAAEDKLRQLDEAD